MFFLYLHGLAWSVGRGMFGTSVNEETNGNQVGSITALVCRALLGAP